MSNSLPPPKQQVRSTAHPVEHPLRVKYTKESQPMKLREAEDYFVRRIAKVFLVSEGDYSPKGSKTLVKGDIFVVCLKKLVLFLTIKDSGTYPVTRTEFALAPLMSMEGIETNAAVKSWEREYQSVTEFLDITKCKGMPLPAALKFHSDAMDHNRQKVPANTILFYIREVSAWVRLRKRHGIEGVDHSGTKHCFLEGEDPLYFSTKLCDIKCHPMYFKSVLQLPQTATVYLHPTMEDEVEERDSLENLSTVTITEVGQDYHLVVRKLSDGGDDLERTAFTIPLNADFKVVAIKLKDSRLLDEILDGRHINQGKAEPYPISAPSDNMVTAAEMESSELEESTSVKHIPRELPPLPPPLLLEEYNQLQGEDLEGLYEEISDEHRTNKLEHNSFGTKYSETEQTATQMLDSFSSGLGRGTPPTTPIVQRPPLVRCKTAPTHQTPSPCPRRRNTTDSQKTLLDACPTEQDLRFHVATKLGRYWRRVGTYLGLRHYQLDQAKSEDCQLEEKAMQALVMWLNGQGYSNKPRNWKTVLEALHLAGQNELASKLKRDITDGW